MSSRATSFFRWELVLLLWLAFFLNQGDRQIFGVTLPLLKADFHLSDTQMGLIATTFSIVFGILVPIAGWAGDFIRRDWVVIASLLIFSLGTLLTGTAAAFLPLLVYRGVATGVGEALYAPAANSLIGSLHDKTRGRALALEAERLHDPEVLAGRGRLDLGGRRRLDHRHGGGALHQRRFDQVDLPQIGGIVAPFRQHDVRRQAGVGQMLLQNFGAAYTAHRIRK